MIETKIKVLIVEDSPSVQQLLKHILNSDSQISIAGIASNGREALEMIKSERPDIITMDMDMPVMDGEETTRIIMETDPIPVIVVTASFSFKEVKNSYRALTAGALAIIEKPVGIGNSEYSRLAKEILWNVKSLANVKLVKRKMQQPVNPTTFEVINTIDYSIQHVAIGASTGGPPVIQKILLNLPREYYTPIYIVQHIATGFLEGFVDWLKSTTGHSIFIPENGMKPEPGKIYVAPSDYHTGLTGEGHFNLQKGDSRVAICPSVSYLFNSLAQHFGKSSAGILLTGMGKDGAAELKLMRQAGAITIAQDKDTSVIYGMPGEAFKIGAAKFVLSPEKITEMLKTLICKPEKSLRNQIS